MAWSGSLPLLLSLLLASAVAYDYGFEQLAGVTNAVKSRGPAPELEAESDCADLCNSIKVCSGYVFEDGICQTYVSDCELAPDDPPAPENYMAKIVCPVVPGNCDCPHGFERYGAQCLLLLDEPETFWFAARSKCSSLDAHAHLAVPRSEAENEQVQLAAGDASVWLGVSWRGNTWYGDDGCRKISQEFWASEQPDVTGRVVFNKAPGPDGWHSQRMNDKKNAHRPLCQLSYCYRPDCADAGK